MEKFSDPTQKLYTTQYRTKKLKHGGYLLIAIHRCTNCNLFFSGKDAKTVMIYGEPQRYCPHCGHSLIKKD